MDVGVAVDLAVAEEVRVLEAGDHAQDAGLLAELEVVLEADEVVGVGAEVFLAELDGGVGPAAGLGVGEAGGLHGAEAQGVAAAAGGLFDGKAAFEVLQFGAAGGWQVLRAVEAVGRGASQLLRRERLRRVRRRASMKAFVLVLGEGAVDVVGGALVPAGGEVDLVHVDGGGVDDGRDGVVEGEVVGAGEALELGGEGGDGERAGGEDGDVSGSVSSRCVTSSRWMVMLGCCSRRSATRAEKATRSTARAWPAGTAVASASASRKQPARRISCLSSQGAEFSDSDLREFEQTSSAKSAVWWASVERCGRIS